MAQFKQPDITNIYWASNDGFKGGRDPMGIQNSSVATYSTLLPGLTNLTGHIRYYSLYCWLLSEYDKLEKENKVLIHQYNFIRRAELAMAIIMKDQGVKSVVGALFISQGRYKLTDDNLYNLANGGDYDSNDKYWTFKSGAFGQYYIGSLIYYDLVKIEEGRFYLRDKGKDLAVAVCESIGDDVRDLYVDCILDGSLAEEEIEELLPLALNKLEIGSEEWKCLNQLLTMVDKDGSSLRRETISLFLQDINNGISVDEFVRYRFIHVTENGNIEASFGWYFYFLCEALHYSIESLLCLILSEIANLHNPPIDILSKVVQKKIIDNLKEEVEYKNLNEWRQCITANIEEIYDEVKRNISEKNLAKAAALSIALMLRLHYEYDKKEKEIRMFEQKYKLSHQHGIFSEGVKIYVGNYISLSIPKYIETIVPQIMQEHTITAIRKMANNNADLRKFIFENGRAVLVEIRYPTETTPRINSLFNFLQDLKYIDTNSQLTNIAYEYLDNYGEK